MNTPDELARIAAVQDGMVTRKQALDRGMTRAGLRHRLCTSQSWQRVLPGVYATFSGPLQVRHSLRAAVLHSGPESMISGDYACRGYGLRYISEPLSILILTPATIQRSCQPLASVRRVRAMPDSRRIHGLPVASPERAVLDVCRGATSLLSVRAVICESVQVGLTTPERLAAALGAARWKGSGLVRHALNDAVAGCRSGPECEFRDVVRASVFLGEPAWNRPLPGITGPPLVPDASWIEARVVVEIDSAEWHRFGDQVEWTERRRARYAAHGWTVIPVSPRRLREEPEIVLREIEDAVHHRLAGRAA